MEIQKLPQELVNQIAAGEVVERPSHMVKELVENSIDAGATEVEVEFDQGGRYVRVSDNGLGIAKEQLPLALARHATSKINKIDDLWHLSSFGFRGEALASIAAVSDFKIISKKSGSDEAYSLHSEFGQYTEPEPCGAKEGTSIVISELFRNVPARLKFLKTEAAESSQIKMTLKAMAMSHPEVSFRVKSKGELIFYWPATESRLQRVESVLEQEGLFVAEGELDGATVEIIFSSPNQTVRSRRQIWGFVQNRWVQDRTIQAACTDAYRSLLMHGEFPYIACFVTALTDDLDVNIHPTKSEVKFKNSSQIYKLIYRNLRAQIETAPWVSELLSGEKPEGSEYQVKISYQADKMKNKEKPQENLSFIEDSLSKTQFQQKSFHRPKTQLPPAVTANNTVDQLETLKVDEEEVGESISSEPSPPPALSVSEVNGNNRELSHWSKLQVLGQVDLTYILTQNEKSMILVDQHAAHERVMFEKLMLSWEQQNFEVQGLLIPEIINLPTDQVAVLLKNREDIIKMGIGMDNMGDDCIAIRSIPSLIKTSSVKKALERLATELNSKGGSVALENVVGDIFASMACHSVVRAGQSLSLEEMKSLLVQMDEFPLSSFCPHGRPVYVEYPFAKIEKDFGRIV